MKRISKVKQDSVVIDVKNCTNMLVLTWRQASRCVYVVGAFRSFDTLHNVSFHSIPVVCETPQEAINTAIEQYLDSNSKKKALIIVPKWYDNKNMAKKCHDNGNILHAFHHDTNCETSVMIAKIIDNMQYHLKQL